MKASRSGNSHRHSAIPRAKYQTRLSDLDRGNAAPHGFIEGLDCSSCLMRTNDRAGGRECLIEVIRGQWPEPFGNTHYCLHPDLRKFVELASSVLSRFDERKLKREDSRARATCAA